MLLPSGPGLRRVRRSAGTRSINTSRTRLHFSTKEFLPDMISAICYMASRISAYRARSSRRCAASTAICLVEVAYPTKSSAKKRRPFPSPQVFLGASYRRLAGGLWRPHWGRGSEPRTACPIATPGKGTPHHQLGNGRQEAWSIPLICRSKPLQRYAVRSGDGKFPNGI